MNQQPLVRLNPIAAALCGLNLAGGLAAGLVTQPVGAAVVLETPPTLAAGVPSALTASDPALPCSTTAQRFLFSVKDANGKEVFFRDFRAAPQAVWTPMAEGGGRRP